MDVAALGESMVTFLPSRPGRLADVPSFDRGIGGAETNVLCTLAAAGHSARWVSRVGADGFGDHLVETIGACGVDVRFVGRDPHRPTGIYFRTAGDRATDAHEVAYYRAGSAASAMAVGTVDAEALGACRVLHLSGITAALSADCLDLLRELTAPRPDRPLVSFDVNFRPGLWHDGAGPEVLLELARRADLVFVGDDEARAAWGLDGGQEILRALPGPRTVVVKRGAAGATAYDRGDARPRELKATDDATAPDRGEARPQEQDATHGATAKHRGDARPPEQDATATSVPAPKVDVVAHVGAGDAFAAGFLSATLRGLPVRDRLRHGHLMAAAALTVPGDLATPPDRDHADRLCALDEAAWERLRLGPGWTTAAADGAVQEGRTP
ncbi:sugar kinase [Streptomyces mexicanus]|uniref:Sugar kinase n=1 Tax=Streptomyces mexicanus TaxID=178566 RepID=A0A7X1LSN5_9ACTN|nr:sugar kinase [Streptomyces mexicanus]